MNKAIRAYMKAVRKGMQCSGVVKKQILISLQQNIERYAEENDVADMQLLCDNFGSPVEMAEELMKDVTPEQRNQYRGKKTVLRVIAGVLAAVVVAFTIYVFFIKQKPIIAYEEINDLGDGTSESSQVTQEGDYL